MDLRWVCHWEWQECPAGLLLSALSLFRKRLSDCRRVLVVDDYEPFRRFERLALVGHDELQIVGECSDGDEAIQKAEELQPDLILLASVSPP